MTWNEKSKNAQVFLLYTKWRKMTATTVANNSGKKVTIASRLVADSAGKTYSGTTVFEIPDNRRKNIPSDIFTRETLQQLTPLQVHVMVDGKTRRVLTHDDFEDNKAVIFESSSDGALEVRFVRREEQRGLFSIWYPLLLSFTCRFWNVLLFWFILCFFYRSIRGMLPLCRSDTDVAIWKDSRVNSSSSPLLSSFCSVFLYVESYAHNSLSMKNEIEVKGSYNPGRALQTFGLSRLSLP